MTLSLAAPAKVNLRLRVGHRGDDGFHSLDTLFCALDLADTVRLLEDRYDEAGLAVAHGPPLDATPPLGDPASNLAVRAARAFIGRAGLRRDAVPGMHLTKRIPAGAGLGGGSSDAAAVLRGLAERYAGALTRDELLEVAAGLGSDVPFFLLDTPLARGTGRGDRVEPLPPLPPRPVVVVLPAAPIATAAAYGWLDADREGGAAEVEPTEPPRSWDDVAAAAVNDFEPPVFARHPALREARDTLREAGARLAMLAGSGAAVFGVFDAAGPADTATERLRGRGLATARTTTRSPRG